MKLTANERNEAGYDTREEKKDKLLPLQMSLCLYQYYPLVSSSLLYFFLSDGT
jgi:hypothetical protein